MGLISNAFASVFRDFETDGVSSSGLYDPAKSELRALGPLIEQAVGNAGLFGAVDVIKDTRANLEADLAHDAGSIALTYADATDANNDLSIKVGAPGSGSWTLTTILHDIVDGLASPALAIVTEWAENPEDDAITGNPGKFSALHHALKAAAAKEAAEGFRDEAAGAAAAMVGSAVAFGRPIGSTLVTGSTGTSANTFWFETAASALTQINSVKAYMAATQTFRIRVGQVINGEIVTVDWLDVSLAAGDNSNALSRPLILQPGQRIGWSNAGTGGLYFATAAGDSGGWRSGPGKRIAVPSANTLNTTTRFQISFIGTVLADAVAKPVSGMDTRDQGFLTTRVDPEIALPTNATGGYLDTFTPAAWADSIATGYGAYGPIETFSGVPLEIAYQVQAAGDGVISRVTTKGEVLNTLNVTSILGVNVLPPETFSAWSAADNWRIHYAPVASGAAKLGYVDAGSGAYTARVTASAVTVGAVLPVRATTAKLAMRVTASKKTHVARIAALEAAMPTLKPTRRLLKGTGVTLIANGSGHNGVIGYGQSNDTGADARPLTSDDSVASAYHKTFAPSVKATKPGLSGANGASNMTGGLQALVEDLVINVATHNNGVTFATRFAKEVSRRLSASMVPPTWLVSIAGFGGGSLAVLSANPGWRENLEKHITQAKAECDALALAWRLHGIMMDQGEQDMALGTSYATYYAGAIALMDAIKAVYQGLGYTNTIYWFWASATKGQALQKEKGVAEAILALCRDRDDCVYVGPAYRYAYVNVSHLTAAGQSLKGAYNARAMAQAIAGYQPDGIRWGGAVDDGTRITVYADGPTQLKLDGGSFTNTLTNFGFAVEDDTGLLTLSGITCGTAFLNASGRLVTPISINRNRALGANPRLRYAKDYAAADNLPDNGAAGNLCDSTTDTVTIDAVTYTMNHFAPPVTLPIVTLE